MFLSQVTKLFNSAPSSIHGSVFLFTFNKWEKRNFSILKQSPYVLHCLGPLGRVRHRVAMSICLSACLWRREMPTSGCCGDLWSKNLFLILACWHNFHKKGGGSAFSSRDWILFWTSLLWIVGEVAGQGSSVAMTVGCWPLAVCCLHFNGTSTKLQWHLHGT